MLRSLAVLGLILASATLLRPASPALAGGTCHKGQPVTDERTANVAMTGNCFSPTIARVEPGATVTWTNDDEAAHAVAGASVSWGGYDELPQRAMFAQSFDEPGIYPYYCIIHPGMVGVVVVGDGRGDGETRIGGSTTAASLDQPSRGAADPAAAVSINRAGAGDTRWEPWLIAGLFAGTAAATLGFAVLRRKGGVAKA